MILQPAPFDGLHFPADEWIWLRKSTRYEPSAPDAFLWAARVSGQPKLWAWHPAGGPSDAPTGGAREARVLVLGGGQQDEPLSELEAFGLWAKTAFTSSAPQEAEWVAALKVLAGRLGHDAARQGLPPHFAEALKASGFEPHLGVLAARERFRFLDRAELAFLFERRWDPAGFELLETFPAGIRASFLAAVAKWGLSAQQTREAAGCLATIARKMGEKAVLALLSGLYASAENLRTTLLRTAQPELFALSEARIEKLRALKAPPRTSVYGDPAFEDDAIRITHQPRALSDLQLFRDWIDDPQVMEKFRSLLEIYRQ